MSRQPLSTAQRFDILLRDQFTCQYCGARAPNVALQVDHVWPVSAGGPNEEWNLCTACEDCNHGKSARTFFAVEQAGQIQDALRDVYYSDTMTFQQMLITLCEAKSADEFSYAIFVAVHGNAFGGRA